MGMETCIGCGGSFEVETMDVTGHGLRCVACSNKAVLHAATAGESMGEHLTPDELREVDVRAGKEMGTGAVLTFGFSLGLAISWFFFIGVAAGLGTFAHGYTTRKKARAALREFPSARVVDQ